MILAHPLLKAIFFLCFWAVPVTGFSTALTEPVPFSLSDLPIQTQSAPTEGQFKQEKFLRNLKKPLVSKGKFNFNKQDKTLLWQIETPIVSSIHLDQDALIQKDAYGNSQRLSAEANPIIQVISQLFINLMALDMSGLKTHFEISLTGSKQAWILHLTPKKGTLDKVFKQIELKGTTRIEQLSIDDVQGEKTLITFSLSDS